MTLYSANIADLARPVTKEKKEKKPATEKQLAALHKAQETRKRKREEKEEMEKMVKGKEEEMIAENEKKEADKLAKKELAKQKRLAKKLTPMNLKIGVEPVAPPPSEDLESLDLTVTQAVEEAVQELPKKRKERDESQPPAWFHAYVKGVKSEEAKQSKEKKPRKVIAAESKKAAGEAWNDGLTRDRVKSEVDSHMNRMFSQIFGARRMK